MGLAVSMSRSEESETDEPAAKAPLPLCLVWRKMGTLGKGIHDAHTHTHTRNTQIFVVFFFFFNIYFEWFCGGYGKAMRFSGKRSFSLIWSESAIEGWVDFSRLAEMRSFERGM